jgi:hypothetical protein
MKITFTQHREIVNGRIVKPGDTLESPKDATDEQLQAYVDNEVATVADSKTPVMAAPAVAGSSSTELKGNS